MMAKKKRTAIAITPKTVLRFTNKLGATSHNLTLPFSLQGSCGRIFAS